MNANNMLVLRGPVEIRDSEILDKYLDKRVANIEKAFTSLTKEFVGYARRTAKLRNNGDEISSILQRYVAGQEFNDSSNESIHRFCSILSIVEDYRNTELDRLKVHVIQPMVECSSKLKMVKKEIKKDFAARKKELSAQQKLEKTRASTMTSQSGSMTLQEAKARNDSQLARLEATRQSEKLGETVVSFEKLKLETLQNVLRSFIHIEMLWHMRALERYTEAYRSLTGVDCLSDQNMFIDSINKLKYKDYLSQSTTSLNLAGKRSQSMTNLRTTNSSSQGDLAAKSELRNSVTFEDQYSRSKSFQNAAPSSNVGGSASLGGSIMRQGQTSNPTLNQNKPPVANGHAQQPGGNRRPDDSDEESYSDDDSYTDDDDEDDPTSRTASARSTNRSTGRQSQPVPVKRNK